MRRPIDLGRVHSAALETAPGPFTGHSGLCNQAVDFILAEDGERVWGIWESGGGRERHGVRSLG